MSWGGTKLLTFILRALQSLQPYKWSIKDTEKGVGRLRYIRGFFVSSFACFLTIPGAGRKPRFWLGHDWVIWRTSSTLSQVRISDESGQDSTQFKSTYGSRLE